MGAHNFHDQAYGATAQEAYKEAVESAYYEYGHDPYNGTISTTSGFTMIPLEPGESIDAWSSRVLEDEGIKKWEECACVKDPDEKESNGRWLWNFAGWAAS